jgi:RNA polymerase sigma-70 factor (ECF subfamily)
MNSLDENERQEPSDGEYVASSRNGCPDHFRLLVQRYQRPLFAYLSSRLGNQLEAEEAAQESFMRAFLSLKKLRKPESFYAWLMDIAGRVLKEQFRAIRDQAEGRHSQEAQPGRAEGQSGGPLAGGRRDLIGSNLEMPEARRIGAVSAGSAARTE